MVNHGGGLLVRHLLVNEVEQPLFKNFISMDGSYFNRNEEYLTLEQQTFTADSFSNSQIYLAGAIRNGNNTVVQRYRQALTSYDMPELHIIYQDFNLTHDQIVEPAFRDALLQLYPATPD